MNVPDQSGRTFLITGATSGLGLETAKAIAAANGELILAGRSPQRLADAQAQIPRKTNTMLVDLADLASVQAAVDELNLDRLDVLINNAGVMATPFGRTVDGFETQIGTNHLGHFALTARLLPLMPVSDPDADCRVVTVSSGAHRMGSVDVEDLNYEHRKYSSWSAYGQSKLANLLFTAELDRRSREAGWSLRAVAAHPGFSDTNLQYAGPKYAHNPVGRALTKVMNSVLAQSAQDGALPQIYAATAADVESGQYIGPDGLFEMRGRPKVVERSAAAQDMATARALWTLSEDLTGVAITATR